MATYIAEYCPSRKAALTFSLCSFSLALRAAESSRRRCTSAPCRRQPLAQVRAQRRGVERGAGTQVAHERQFLAHARIVDAEHHHLLHCGVAVGHVLDLAGVDVLAAADHQFLVRPVMCRKPSPSIRPTSPVRIQPSSVKSCALASGFSQYPGVHTTLRSWISPCCPGAARAPRRPRSVCR